MSKDLIEAYIDTVKAYTEFYASVNFYWLDKMKSYRLNSVQRPTDKTPNIFNPFHWPHFGE